MTTKTLSIKEATKIVKPFIGSLAGKPGNWSRPVLKTALVTPNHILATDSHRAIRIKHNESLDYSYLHEYKPNHVTSALEATNYPNLERLFPNEHDAQHSFQIDIKEWLTAHDLGLIAAKEHKNNQITLEANILHVKPVTHKDIKDKNSISSSGIKGYKTVQVPKFEQLSFNYGLQNDSGVEKVTYNCKYMIDLLKAFKKLGTSEITCYFYGPMRPMLFKTEEAEALILPVRK